MASHSARSRPSPAAGPDIWLGLVSTGLAAWSDLTRSMIDQAAAQTKSITDFYAAAPALRIWPSQQELLLLFENQAEQLADGCRHTLDDLQRQGEAAVPPALPD